MALIKQDLTTYVKVDSAGRITSITADKVEWVNLVRTESVHLTDDKGAGNIDMTKLAFSLLHKSIATVSSSLYAFFAVATVADDIVGMGDVPRFVVFSNPSAGSNDRFFISMAFPPGNAWTDNTVNTSINVERLMVGSISPDGLTYTLIIYAGAVVGPVFDVLTFTATAPCPDTRYTYALSSFNTGGSGFPNSGQMRSLYVDIDGLIITRTSPHMFGLVQ